MQRSGRAESRGAVTGLLTFSPIEWHFDTKGLTGAQLSSKMRPAFGDWRSLVAHFVRDEGVGGSNPLSPTKFEKPAQRAGFFASVTHEEENLRGRGGSTRRRPDKTRQRRIRQMYRPIVGFGATALSDLHTTHFPAKFAPHISLSINGFVTETIVFFYICLNLFLRYLWLALAFSAVRFSVHGINRSDIHLFLRFFSLNA